MKDALKILIIDDDEGDRKQFKRILKQTQLGDCIEASSVIDALATCQKQIFDCAIIDYKMPGDDGLYGITALHQQFPDMPIIMSTARGNEKVATEAMKHGASDYIVKENLEPTLLRKTIFVSIEKFLLTKKLKEKETKIEHMAHYDYLTEIPNRLYFYELLSKALMNAKRHMRILAVLFLDLDYFKNVNDALGHESGDILLKQVVKRFQSVLRNEDMLARLGGDEYAILLSEINKREGAGITAQKLIDSLKEPFLLGNETISITVSIGIATYPVAGETVAALMRSADKAMYQAKNIGRNNFQFYTPEFNLKK